MPRWRNWQTCLPAGRRAGQSYMFYVYVIKSNKRNYTYVGITNNLDRRINQHQNGREKTTAPYRPFIFLFTEPFPSRIEARNREKYLKSGIGREWIKNHF